jgi:hypothetical protein
MQGKEAGLIINGLGANTKGLMVPFGNVGIGTYNPTQKLDVNGSVNIGAPGTNYVLPGARGADGQVLKTDSTGVVSWQEDNAGGGGGGSDSAIKDGLRGYSGPDGYALPIMAPPIDTVPSSGCPLGYKSSMEAPMYMNFATCVAEEGRAKKAGKGFYGLCLMKSNYGRTTVIEWTSPFIINDLPDDGTGPDYRECVCPSEYDTIDITGGLPQSHGTTIIRSCYLRSGDGAPATGGWYGFCVAANDSNGTGCDSSTVESPAFCSGDCACPSGYKRAKVWSEFYTSHTYTCIKM